MIQMLKKWFSQPSTKKGIALVGAGAALAAGHPELLTVSITGDAVNYGGLIGSIAPVLIGSWEMARNEFKDK